VVSTFGKGLRHPWHSASTLTDNGMVFTTGFSGGKGGRNHLEHELGDLGIVQINSTPGHPTTCGKVGRFHQTLNKWLTSQPRATSIDHLQTQLDAFVEI
jgi:transposase InsO family protein